ncbi:MAG TPA: SAM-dependent methyltransferase, partial [Candidatus Ozemobacteraceae bacterium]|nr:SAM-dependent methyltransferase [Candidatus Ozemobacteraceae bacterium]
NAYPFRISAATDDRPYFYHFLKWSSLSDLFAQFGNRARPFVELGSLLMVLAMIQAGFLTVLLLLFPIVVVRGWRGVSRKNMASLGYFCAIGAGYMLLEMGCMQKLVLFLGHPVYSAATVIAGFLVFSGLGSMASDIVAKRPGKAGITGAAVVALLAASSPWLLDGAIRIAMHLPDWQKFPLGMLFIAPLAFPMGIFFPLGFRHIMKTDEDLAPWAWGANGFASVLATLGAPLLAMRIGFSGLAFLAAACYLSIALFWLLQRPDTGES